MKGLFDHFCNFVRAFIGIIDPEIVIKNNLAFITDAPMMVIIVYQTLV